MSDFVICDKRKGRKVHKRVCDEKCVELCEKRIKIEKKATRKPKEGEKKDGNDTE